MYDWCQDFIDKLLPQYEPFINLSDIELNVSESCEYVVKDDLKVIFNLENVKEYVKITESGENLNSRVLKHKVIYRDKEYDCTQYYENYLPKCDIDDEWDYRVEAMNAKRSNDNYYVYFNVIT